MTDKKNERDRPVTEPRKLVARFTHEEVREAVGPDEDGCYDIDRGYEIGQQYEYRMIRLEHIYGLAMQRCPSPLVIEQVRQGADLGYDYSGLIRTISDGLEIPPIVVREHGDVNVLLDGKRRLIALGALGETRTYAFVRLPYWQVS